MKSEKPKKVVFVYIHMYTNTYAHRKQTYEKMILEVNRKLVTHTDIRNISSSFM